MNIPRLSHLVRAVFLVCVFFSQPVLASVKLGGSRPADLHLPKDFDTTRVYPMILVLHGYDNSGRNLAFWTSLAEEGNRLGYLTLIPVGTPDLLGKNFWNAVPECCDYFFTDRDDVSYLANLIAEARQHAQIGPVYIIGHSNGGFMAFRMACERPELVNGIVSVSGGFYKQPDRCQSPGTLSALFIHGSGDLRVPMDGNLRFSGPRQSAEDWASIQSCQDISEEKARLNIVKHTVWSLWAKGNETDALLYSGCRDGTQVGLWTVNGGGHNIDFDELLETAMQFFQKPIGAGTE